MLNLNIYHCIQCKKIVNSIEDLLFIQTGHLSGMCSEECIERYFSPLAINLNTEIINLKNSLNDLNEKLSELMTHEENLNQILTEPDELWMHKVADGLDRFVLIKEIKIGEHQPFTAVCICHIFNGSPSYIYHVSACTNREFLKSVKVGEKISNVEEYIFSHGGSVYIDPNISPEMEKYIEQKKSLLLASHLQIHKETDIGLEQYHLYDKFNEETILDPDEHYHMLDEEDDSLDVFIKSFDENGTSFFYILVCHIQEQESEEEGLICLPILSFPTVDSDLCAYYRQGEMLEGPIKN